MKSIADLKTKFILISYLLFVSLCIADAVNIELGVIAVIIPEFFIITSFLIGTARITLKRNESIILLIFNIIFLLLTYKVRLFMLNIFLISLLIWVFITPHIINFKDSFIICIVMLLFSSFYIPYFKLPTSLLLSFLFYPFYLFGFMINNIKIIKCKITKIYLIIGIIISSVSLFFIFTKSLNLKNNFNLMYVQSMYTRNDAFVYLPIIVLNFLIVSFSILILLSNNTAIKENKNILRVNFRAAIASLCAVLPVSFLIYIMNLNKYGRLCSFLILMAVNIRLYIMLNEKLKYTSYKKYKEPLQNEIDIKNIYLKLLFTITFVFAIVASIEYVLRGYNILLTVNYIATTSFAYNIIFVSLIYLFAISLFGIKLGSLVILILHAFMVAGNYIKLRFLNEPLYLWDTYLIKDLLIISREYVKSSMIMIIFTLLTLGIILIFKNINSVIRALKPVPNFKFMFLVFFPLLFNLNMLNNNRLSSINIAKDWYDGIDEFLRNGTYVESYLYLKDLDKYLNKKPKDYSENKIKQIEEQINTENKASDLNPNVIVVLNESFWDLNNLKDIKINKQINKNLNKYRNGTILSPSFGWETANVEFEVLTGLSNFYFNKGIIPYNVYLNRNIPNIVSTFNKNGYTTIAIHPNIGSMYNRSKVYKYLGFDSFKDISSFNLSEDIKGNNVSDDKVVDKIIATLKDGGNPKFIFAATIQNHDPYDKSSKVYNYREIDVKSNKLSSMEMDMLSNYAQGVYDADKSLGKLIREISKIKRPTLVYYFGDHLPRLGLPEGIFDIYEKLNYVDVGIKPENDPKFYETPLIIWSNYKKMSKINDAISPNQLAIEILQDAGIRYPKYFNYLIKLRESYPYLNKYLMDKNKIINEYIINDYYLIQYDVMFGNQYLNKGVW